MRAFEISASLSCVDLLNVEREIQAIEATEISFIHYDVVDGEFNDCFVLGDEMLRQIKSRFDIPIEVHLAVKNVEKYIEPFVRAGADTLAIHYESSQHPIQLLDKIRKHGKKAVLAFRAETPVPHDFETLLEHCDGVLKLTVNPGYSGQVIQLKSLKHIREMKDRICAAGKNIKIQADGNVNPTTIRLIVESGADIVTGGSSGLFNHMNLEDNIRKLYKGLL